MNGITASGRVALVTGASSGFGALAAQRFRGLGFRVFGTSRSGAGGGEGIEMLLLDVDSDASVRACAETLLHRAGRIDVLVNNAGRALVGACEETRAAEARALFETNLFGVMRVVSALVPQMRRQGHGAIVNVGSVSGYLGTPFHGVYAASKHALAGYSEALGFELRAFGIRVRLVEPDAHRTGIQMSRPEAPLAVYDLPRERVEAIIRRQIDQGRDPMYVVDAIVAAATSDSSRFRYRVGAKATLLSLGRRVLSDGLIARAVRHEFELDRTPVPLVAQNPA
jgi:NAD(P)-dependent dehydrogenase (short-subunit alcohol dehydrogenase family)